MVDFRKVGDRLAKKREGYVDCIIAGSRGLAGMGDYELVSLAAKRSGYKVLRVISGTAKGVDTAGERWATEHGIEVKRVTADWGADGKSAGYKRNERMRNQADALIAVWDGESRGTKHMVSIMHDVQKPVYLLKVMRWWLKLRLPDLPTTLDTMAVTQEDGALLWVPDVLKQFLGCNIEELIEKGNAEVERV